jgi:hypothetical protein
MRFINFSVDRFFVIWPPTDGIYDPKIYALNSDPEDIREIQHIEVEPTADDYKDFPIWTHYCDLFRSEARIASIRFTFNDWAMKYPTWSTFQAKYFLEINDKYTELVRPGEFEEEEWKEKGWLPSLELQWKTAVDTGLWPCAESEAVGGFHDLL